MREKSTRIEEEFKPESGGLEKRPSNWAQVWACYARLRRFDLVLFRGSIRALTDLSADLVVSICSSGVIAQMTEKLKGLREPVVEAKGGK